MISPSKRRAAGSNNKPNHPTGSSSNSSKRSKTTPPVDTATTAVDTPMDTTVVDIPASANHNNVLDLHRLLHVMETDPSPTGKTARDLLLRADWLREQFQLWQHNNNNSKKSHQGVDSSQQQLAERVEAAYQAAQRAALALQQQQTQPAQQQSVEDDPVQKIFFPKTGTAKTDTETHSNLVDSSHSSQDKDKNQNKKPAAAPTHSPTSRSSNTIRNNGNGNGVTNVQALQRKQQEQMEEAVAAMAQQMKHQTAQIHAQLKQQTVTLTNLEDVATQNVESVTKVAQRTQQHNRTAWGKTIGKWTLLFTVVAAFVATLLTISMVPKRPNACLFFCKSQQQFCRMVHGKQECLDDAPATTTVVRPEKSSPAVTQDATITTAQMGHPEPPVVEVAAALEMDQEKGRPQIQESLPVMGAGTEANDDNDDDEDEDDQEEDEDDDDEKEYQEEDEDDEDGDDDEPLPYQDPVFHQAAHAAATGAFKELRRILRDRPDLLNVQDNNGWTLLMEASLNGKTEAVRVLLMLQANALTETYERRHTALTLAREALGEEHSVVTLLRHYVAESVKDDNDAQQQQPPQEQECQLGMDGECLSATPVDTEPAEEQQQQVPEASVAEEIRQEALREYYAQQQNHHERNPDEILDDEEATHSMENSHDDNTATGPLEVASWQVRDAAERGDHKQLSQYIRESRSTDMLLLLEEGDANGWNALHLAARAGHGHVVELLLSAGLHAQLETNSGKTALQLAVEHHGEEHAVTELLMQYQ